MSITFWVPDAERRREKVPCDSPAYGLVCTPTDLCGYCEGGYQWESVSDAPEVNFANQNAYDILRLLGHSPAPGGEWAVETLPSIRRAIFVALARPSARDHLVLEGGVDEGEVKMVVGGDNIPTITRGCTIIYGGNTDAQTVSRLERLQEVVVWAQENGLGVGWG